VVGPDLSGDFPPLRTPPADHHNLVRPTTPLVGRVAALEELSNLVSAHRLVSVVGPGGLGKSRIVIDSGIAHAPEWPDGVWFVDLTTVSDAHAIPEALATATAAPHRPRRRSVASGDRTPPRAPLRRDRRQL
jgi:hypothetical protein